MKKIIAFVMIVGLGLISTTLIDAKTTKKKTKARTSQTATFDDTSEIDGASKLEHSLFFTDYEDFTGLNDVKTIIASLTENGFKKKSTSTVREYYGEERVSAKKIVYSNNGTAVDIVDFRGQPIYVEVKFADKSQLDAFLSKMKSAGWSQSYTHGNFLNFNKDSSDMTVEGTTVTFTTGG